MRNNVFPFLWTVINACWVAKGGGFFHLKGEGFFHLNLLLYRTDTVLYLCNICENTYFDLQKINSLVF